MNRRQFLRALALGGGIVAGELWVPGAKKVFLPPTPKLVDTIRVYRSDFSTFNPVPSREDLADIIYSISPVEVPVYEMAQLRRDLQKIYES